MQRDEWKKNKLITIRKIYSKIKNHYFYLKIKSIII